MLDDYSYGGHSGHGGHGKQTYVHEEHKKAHYDSDDYSDYSDYSDHENISFHGHSGLKFRPSHYLSAHKVHGHGGGWGSRGHHRAQQVQVGACGRPLPPPVDYLYPGPPRYHSEWQSQEEVNYYGQPPAWSGYRLEAPKTPARKVFINPGYAVGGSVERLNKPSWVEKKL